MRDRSSEPPPHGTRRCYQTHRCNCVECRAANTAYCRESVRLAAARWAAQGD